LDQQVGESSSTVHDSGAGNDLSLLLVGSAGLLTIDEGGVDTADRGIVALLGPGSEVSVVEFGRVNTVLINHLAHFRTICGPVGSREGEFGKSGVLVSDRVPDGVEVGDTVDDRGDVLEVATSVTLGVIVTHFGSSVEGLVDITGVVNDKTEGKSLLVSQSREVAGNLLVVGRVFVVVSVHEEVGQVLEGIDVVYIIFLEFGEVGDGLGGVGEVGLVDEVPS